MEHSLYESEDDTLPEHYQELFDNGTDLWLIGFYLDAHLMNLETNCQKYKDLVG